MNTVGSRRSCSVVESFARRASSPLPALDLDAARGDRPRLVDGQDVALGGDQERPQKRQPADQPLVDQHKRAGRPEDRHLTARGARPLGNALRLGVARGIPAITDLRQVAPHQVLRTHRIARRQRRDAEQVQDLGARLLAVGGGQRLVRLDEVAHRQRHHRLLHPAGSQWPPEAARSPRAWRVGAWPRPAPPGQRPPARPRPARSRPARKTSWTD